MIFIAAKETKRRRNVLYVENLLRNEVSMEILRRECSENASLDTIHAFLLAMIWYCNHKSVMRWLMHCHCVPSGIRKDGKEVFRTNRIQERSI